MEVALSQDIVEWNATLRATRIGHLPARVSLRTCERYFSPESAERLQHIVWEGKSP
jgi:hypothetical protein